MAIWEQPDLYSGLSLEAKEEKKKAELALCIPHQNIISMEWALAFRHLRLPPYLYFFNKGMPIDVAREQMVRSALKHDIKYIFFLDSDIVLNDPDGVLKLIEISKQFNLPVVSGLYFAKKRDVIQPAAWKIVERKGNDVKLAPVANIEEHIKKNHVIEVDAIGLGLAVIRRDVFDKLEEKDPGKPFFEWGLGRQNLPQVSEDFFFCLKLLDNLNIHPHVATIVRAHHICMARRNRDNGKLELTQI